MDHQLLHDSQTDASGVLNLDTHIKNLLNLEAVLTEDAMGYQEAIQNVLISLKQSGHRTYLKDTKP